MNFEYQRHRESRCVECFVCGHIADNDILQYRIVDSEIWYTEQIEELNEAGRIGILGDLEDETILVPVCQLHDDRLVVNREELEISLRRALWK